MHVGDKSAQQALAVAGGDGGGVPQRGQVGCQRLPGVGERGEPGFLPGFQGAGDQPVLRLDGAEGPLGVVGLIPGMLDGKLGRAADPESRRFRTILIIAIGAGPTEAQTAKKSSACSVAILE